MFNMSPLHYSSYVGNFEISRLLVKHGANVNVQNCKIKLK